MSKKGSVYEIRPGKFIGSIDIGYDANGKRIRKTTKTFNYYDDAERALTALKYDINEGNELVSTKELFVPFLRNYYESCEHRWEDTTKALYKMYIDVHFEPYFDTMKLSAIKPITLDTFYRKKMTEEREYTITINGTKIKRKQPPISVNTAIKLNKFLRSAFKYAIVNKLAKSNPADNVSLGKKVDYTPMIYDEDKFKILMNVVAGTDDEIPIVLAAGCGFRRGEIFGLVWKNVDFKNKTITIEKTEVDFNEILTKAPKTKKSARTISVPSNIIKILENHKARTNGKPNSKVVTKWKPKAYSEHFKKLLKNNGMTHIRFHDLRHFNATMMMNKGISDKTAAERLGHSNVQTLRNIYQHVLKDADINAANELDVIFDVETDDKTNKKASGDGCVIVPFDQLKKKKKP